jgi:hypothetical protein
MRLERLGWAYVVLVGGLVFSLAAFSLTALKPPQVFLGGCRLAILSEQYSDPWTGAPYGRLVVTCPDPEVGQRGRVVREATSRWNWAMPIPVGVVVGSLLTLGFLRLTRPDGTHPSSA